MNMYCFQTPEAESQGGQLHSMDSMSPQQSYMMPLNHGYYPTSNLQWPNTLPQTEYFILPNNQYGNSASYPHAYGSGTPGSRENNHFRGENAFRLDTRSHMQTSSLAGAAKGVLRYYHCPRCQGNIPPGEMSVILDGESERGCHSGVSNGAPGPSSWPEAMASSPCSPNQFLAGDVPLVQYGRTQCSETPSPHPKQSSITAEGNRTLCAEVFSGTQAAPSLHTSQKSSYVDSATAMEAEGNSELSGIISPETTEYPDKAIILVEESKRTRTRHHGPHKRRKTAAVMRFQCAIGDCSQSFTLEKDLLRHQEQSLAHQGQGPESGFLCEETRCASHGRSYTRQDNFERHVRTMHAKFGVSSAAI